MRSFTQHDLGLSVRLRRLRPATSSSTRVAVFFPMPNASFSAPFGCCCCVCMCVFPRFFSSYRFSLTLRRTTRSSSQVPNCSPRRKTTTFGPSTDKRLKPIRSAFSLSHARSPSTLYARTHARHAIGRR